MKYEALQRIMRVMGGTGKQIYNPPSEYSPQSQFSTLDFINNDKNAAMKWLNYPRLSEKTIAYKYDFCSFLF